MNDWFCIVSFNCLLRLSVKGILFMFSENLSFLLPPPPYITFIYKRFVDISRFGMSGMLFTIINHKH